MFEEKQAMGKGECGRSCYSPDVNFIRVSDLETIKAPLSLMPNFVI